MKLGWKLFLLLLGFSLVPFAALRINAVRGMERLGAELSEHVGTFLVHEAESRMSDLVEDHARLLLAKRDNLALLLRLQAGAVRKRLFDPAPAGGEDASFLVRVRPMSRHDRDTDPGYRLLRPDGSLSPAGFTDAPLLFTAPPAIPVTDLRPEMARLAPLAGDLAALDRPGKPPVWRVVTLTGGLTAVTLVDGQHPGLFDPRESFWYRSSLAAKAGDDPVWTLPYVVPALKRIVLTTAMPLRDAAGKIVAVTAITTPLDDLLDELAPGGHISHELASFLVTAEQAAGDAEGERQLLAAAGSRPIRGRHGWLTRVEPEQVRSENREVFTEVARDVAEGRKGVRRLPFEGRDSLWAYAPVGQGQALLQIAPVAEVLAESRSATAYVERRIADQVRFSGFVAGLVMLMLIPATLLGARTVTRPAADLARAARRLAKGDFSARAHPRGRDELAELGGIFNEMAPQLADRVRMRESLELAMEVQHRLLPKSPPQVPGLDMAALSIYCDETGGDYYDFFTFTGKKAGRLGVVVGDVTGHGVGAALLMATARALLRPRAEEGGTPGEIMAGVNRDLTLDTMGTGRFMTLFYLEIDQATRRLAWARAGHDPALLYDPRSGTFLELDGRGVPLGIVEDASYEDKSAAEAPAGAMLVIGSDGIWETRSPEGEMFGKDRLRDIVRDKAAAGSRAVLEAVVQALDDFRGDCPQEDDVTLVVAAFHT